MATDDGQDFTCVDWRELTPEQWSELRRNAIQRAELLRHQSNVAMLRKAAALIRNGAARIADSMSNTFAWLKTAADRRAAIKRLQKLDDRVLKDIGMDRSEIETVVHAHGGDKTRLRRDTQIAA